MSEEHIEVDLFSNTDYLGMAIKAHIKNAYRQQIKSYADRHMKVSTLKVQREVIDELLKELGE